MTLTIAREGRVAVVTVDNPPVNALSQALRQALWDAAETLDADSDGRRRRADLRRAHLHRRRRHHRVRQAAGAAAPARPRRPHRGGGEALDRRDPWLAPSAAASRWRSPAASASPPPTASVGLPEVTLGIVPGAGGTVRLPRLVPPAAAVDIATTGKPVKAAKALELGLIDRVIDGDLRTGAIAFAAETRPLPDPLRRARPRSPPTPAFGKRPRRRCGRPPAARPRRSGHSPACAAPPRSTSPPRWPSSARPSSPCAPPRRPPPSATFSSPSAPHPGPPRSRASRRSPSAPPR